MFLKFFLGCFLLLFLISCSNETNNNLGSINNEKETPETIYIEAMQKFDDQNFAEALIIFQHIEKIYPLSKLIYLKILKIKKLQI